MDEIVRGVARFQRDGFPQRKDLFKKLEGGQEPRILFITCSDSRVVPHLITDSEPGQLFVIRNAGNLVPPYAMAPGGEQATIEYAISGLGVTNVIVCGHSGCGAMKALLDPSSAASMPSVARWLDLARPARAVVDSMDSEGLGSADRLARTVEVNVLRQLDSLRGHPAVAAALARNAITLHGWVYDIGSGAITSYDPSQKAFVELAETMHPVGQDLRLRAASADGKRAS